ncbi:MAG: CoA transferase, partial [Planctomycetes bacterium]|nr:CoA transferase [Planctomycetota bacterium]
THPTAGTLTYPGLPYHLSCFPQCEAGPAPLLGQANQAVFCQRLGLEPAALAALGREGVV